MVNGSMEGKGIFYYLDGKVYKGEWKRGVKEGYGIEEGPDTYEGQWLDNVKCGTGKIIFEDGSKYQGEF